MSLQLSDWKIDNKSNFSQPVMQLDRVLWFLCPGLSSIVLNMSAEFTQLLKNPCSASGLCTMHPTKLFQRAKEMIQIMHRPVDSTVSPVSQKYRQDVQKTIFSYLLEAHVILHNSYCSRRHNHCRRTIVQFLELE